MEPLYNGAGAAIRAQLLCSTYASNLWNVKTGQNILWSGPKTTLYPKELFAITRKQLL